MPTVVVFGVMCCRLLGSVRGLEPRESRRQLEQQREELPVGESQQEFAGQSEQQPRVPPGRLARSSEQWTDVL